ncbi:ribonuclease P protein subunit p14 isoform X3 [Bemisia tabaci]|uniref:ribonuclease P protein subunit p14 isoform X3 n=1 Tax=Bemisia tabaci TaxID=7038 RepID=UPI003B288ADB
MASKCSYAFQLLPGCVFKNNRCGDFQTPQTRKFEVLPKHSEISAVDFKHHVMKSVKILFGQVGINEFIELLSYDTVNHRGIFVCSREFYVKFRAAISLTKKFEGFNCSYLVNKVSPNALSLLSNSRTYTHE